MLRFLISHENSNVGNLTIENDVHMATMIFESIKQVYESDEDYKHQNMYLKVSSDGGKTWEVIRSRFPENQNASSHENND